MFEIRESTWGASIRVVSLINTHSGETAEILAGCGATLNRLRLNAQGLGYELVKGSAGYQQLLEEGLPQYRGMILFPTPNRVQDGEYFYQGTTYSLDVNETDRRNSLHGLLVKADFTIDYTEISEKSALVVLRHLYKAVHPGYPFETMVEVVYQLDCEGLTCKTKIYNRTGRDIPAGIGWHPYFTTGTRVNDLLICIPSTKALETDGRMIPTGSLLDNPYSVLKPIGDYFFDTGYVLESGLGMAETIIHDPVKGVKLTVWQKTGHSGYNYVQVYSPPTRDCLAIEPMTCAANSFNNDLGKIVLVPNKTSEAVYGVKLIAA